MSHAPLYGIPELRRACQPRKGEVQVDGCENGAGVEAVAIIDAQAVEIPHPRSRQELEDGAVHETDIGLHQLVGVFVAVRVVAAACLRNEKQHPPNHKKSTAAASEAALEDTA